MKLISFERATLLKLGVLARAEGQVYLPDLVAALAEQFQFVKIPDLSASDEDGNPSLQFSQGKFKNFAIESLGIYNDGVVIKSATDTAFLDEFASSLEQWADQEFGVEFVPSHSVGTIYESNIIVQAESEFITKVLPKLNRLEKSLKAKCLSDSNLGVSFAFGGITLSVDSCQIETFKPQPFRFERRVGTERKLGHFFSAAPLSTKSHLELLGELEALG